MPRLRTLVIVCLVGAISFGLLAVLALREASSAPVGGILMLLALAGCVAGALYFGGLARTSAGAQAALAGEKVLAEGVGRHVKGLRGQVVVATDHRIVALPARLTGEPKIAKSIAYGDVTGVEVGQDTLVVVGRNQRVALAKCAPNQVAALVAELRRRTSVDF